VFATGMAFAYAFQAPAVMRIAERAGVNRTLDGISLLILALLFLSARHYHETFLNALPLVGPWFQMLAPKMGLHYKAAFSLLCGLLIFATLASPTRLAHRVLSSLFLRALGVTSYSLYLLHIIVRNKIAALGFAMSNEELFLWTLAIAYALACILYAGVERPFMQMRDPR
jgi:peptidoglycan/LPS O-acetylase OafA/YrhL